MSSYKVPQDVEADDKIIGPFSFRQFIYLIIVALAGFIAYGLAQLFLPLAMIPLPIILFFGALALPLRKDQPMEIFMAAMVSFYLKPRKRLWDPSGVDSLIEITAPKTPEVQRTKDITQDEAQRRLSYLSEIVDSQGWAVRGTDAQPTNSPLKSDAYFEAQQTVDILDEDNKITQRFDEKLNKSKTDRHEAMAKIISGQSTSYFDNKPIAEPVAEADIVDTSLPEEIDYNPYPDIQQSVIQPLNESDGAKPPTIKKPTPPKLQDISENKPVADIINYKVLAENDDLSIATIAREANRMKEKQDLEAGVFIQINHDN